MNKCFINYNQVYLSIKLLFCLCCCQKLVLLIFFIWVFISLVPFFKTKLYIEFTLCYENYFFNYPLLNFTLQTTLSLILFLHDFSIK